jgi:purine-binding chemotaxis protein CheW
MIDEMKTSEADAAKAVLRARAKALAKRADPLASSRDSLGVVEFTLAKERYAIEQQWVREIYPFKMLTPLPCTPPFLLGIINVRGQVMPVIDIKKFFEMPESGIADMHSVIIVQVDDVEIGILADSIAGVRSIPAESIELSLPTLTGVRADYLRGVTVEHVVILDAPRILRDSRLVVDEEVAT